MKLVYVALIALLMTGCATSGRDFSQQTADSIKSGVTTRAEVIEMLGQPSGVISGSTNALTGESRLGDDSVSGITYGYSSLKLDAVSMIPIIGLFAGGSDSTNKMLQVYFDKNDVVTETLYTTQDIGTNSAF